MCLGLSTVQILSVVSGHEKLLLFNRNGMTDRFLLTTVLPCLVIKLSLQELVCQVFIVKFNAALQTKFVFSRQSVVLVLSLAMQVG